MDNDIELLSKRLDKLEQKLEIYYQLLKIDNEIDFIMKGTYVLESDIEDILSGSY